MAIDGQSACEGGAGRRAAERGQVDPGLDQPGQPRARARPRRPTRGSSGAPCSTTVSSDTWRSVRPSVRRKASLARAPARAFERGYDHDRQPRVHGRRRPAPDQTRPSRPRRAGHRASPRTGRGARSRSCRRARPSPQERAPPRRPRDRARTRPSGQVASRSSPRRSTPAVRRRRPSRLAMPGKSSARPTATRCSVRPRIVRLNGSPTSIVWRPGRNRVDRMAGMGASAEPASGPVGRPRNACRQVGGHGRAGDHRVVARACRLPRAGPCHDWPGPVDTEASGMISPVATAATPSTAVRSRAGSSRPPVDNSRR